MSEIAAQDPAALVEQGRGLHREGRIDEAERVYRQALAVDEFCAEAHQLLAVIAGQRGNFDEAIKGFRHSIALEGPTPERLYNLAEACRVAGQFQNALDAYNQTLAIDASYVDAYRSCAAMIRDAAERAQAGGDGHSAQQLRRMAAHYLLGLGHANLRAGDVANAEQAYRDSVVLDPEHAEAYNCLGVIALEGGLQMEAEALCRRACALSPKSPLFLNNLGRALLAQVRTDEAVEQFQHAIEVDPSFADARTNLEERILPWLLYRDDLPPSAVLAAHQRWGRVATESATKAAAAPAIVTAAHDRDRPLRIGYVGIDTASRLAHSCLVPLIANHDPKAARAVLYASAGRAVEAERFKHLAERFQPLALRRAPQAAKMIQNARIDVLIDVAGHMPHNRLDIFAHSPGPVTATWLGYPGTTGLSTVDYRITDEVVDPAGADKFYTEHLYRLGTGFCVYRPPASATHVNHLPARASGVVTFGNFDDPRKISARVVQAWSSILRALSGARLLLLAREFGDPAFAARLRADFQVAGASPEQIELRRAPDDPSETIRAYAEVDIGLDTFPYNGALTTICEALWMGVPVVTLFDDRPWGRTSTSLVAQVGLERLDSHTVSEYVETAIELAEDLERLHTLRSGMRERMQLSPLMDERGFARRFEAAVRDMWWRSIEPRQRDGVTWQ